METSNMKNMLVLKDLPSNLVEEAIVILKSSKKVKKLEKIDKKNKIEKREIVGKEKDYVLKEAEMLIINYITKLENNQEQKRDKMNKVNKRYRQLKKYAFVSSFIMLIQALLLITK